MHPEQTTQIVNNQINKCATMLTTKRNEYAPNQDALHNFRTAAALQNIPMRQALAGMMAKHTVSVYDICHSPNLPDTQVLEEKITDHINYLLLLRAVLHEESTQAPPATPPPPSTQVPGPVPEVAANQTAQNWQTPDPY